jgi:uncharacterized protein (DUF1684 family)
LIVPSNFSLVPWHSMLEVSVTNRDKTKVAADKIASWIAIEFISNDTLKLAVNFTDPETISIPVS